MNFCRNFCCLQVTPLPPWGLATATGIVGSTLRRSLNVFSRGQTNLKGVASTPRGPTAYALTSKHKYIIYIHISCNSHGFAIICQCIDTCMCPVLVRKTNIFSRQFISKSHDSDSLCEFFANFVIRTWELCERRLPNTFSFTNLSYNQAGCRTPTRGTVFATEHTKPNMGTSKSNIKSCVKCEINEL